MSLLVTILVLIYVKYNDCIAAIGIVLLSISYSTTTATATTSTSRDRRFKVPMLASATQV